MADNVVQCTKAHPIWNKPEWKKRWKSDVLCASFCVFEFHCKSNCQQQTFTMSILTKARNTAKLNGTTPHTRYHTKLKTETETETETVLN